jgi:Ni,Fe-hydrogenase III large subunit
MLINIDEYNDKKTALVDIEVDQGNKIHRSFLSNDGKIIAYEMIAENYPAWALIVFESIFEYYNEIKEVDWIISEIKISMLDTIKELLLKRVD